MLSPSTTPAFVSKYQVFNKPFSLAGGANSSDLSFDVGAGGTTGIHLFKIIGAGPSVQIVEGSNIQRTWFKYFIFPVVQHLKPI